MRDYYFHSPTTLDDAIRLLDEHQIDPTQRQVVLVKQRQT